MSNVLNTNKWHHVQTTEAYIDFEKEIASFGDEGNSSVDMRMTFDLENNSAYIVMVQRNDIASPRDLEPDSIPVDWNAAKKMLADDGVDIGPLVQVVIPNEEVPCRMIRLSSASAGSRAPLTGRSKTIAGGRFASSRRRQRAPRPWSGSGHT
jgi:hypothetical protein